MANKTAGKMIAAGDIMETGPKVFISYRRDDSAGHAGRLAADMRQCFGEEQVFYDLVSIIPGDEFPQKIKAGPGRVPGPAGGHRPPLADPAG